MPRYIDRMTAVPEVRGGSDALRGQVEVVGGAEDRVFRARLTGRTEVPHFLVGAYEEAAICVHSLARGWQTR
ncbi:hypothetical protein [Nonomuraea sp. NPDC005650]|uniref:hypothetical protein n=1 Tax=Nonomuraea sp. NPDC005650 TaxID=3157045 RepID=UPI0033BF9005